MNESPQTTLDELSRTLLPSPTLTGTLVFDGIAITGEQIVKMVRALSEIADQDIVELALDPDWSRRIAKEALKP